MFGSPKSSFWAVLRLTSLEERSIPSVYHVTGLDDGGGTITVSGMPGVDYEATTIRTAVLDANAHAATGPHTIQLDSGSIYTLTLEGNDDTASAGDLDIKCNLTISGSNSHLDIGKLDRHFQVFPGQTVSLSGLVLLNGKSFQGGSIYNAGKLTLTNTHVSGEVAGAIAQGGAIYNSDTGELVVTGDGIYLSGEAKGTDGTNGTLGIDGTGPGVRGTDGGRGGDGGIAHGGVLFNLGKATLQGNINCSGLVSGGSGGYGGAGGGGGLANNPGESGGSGGIGGDGGRAGEALGGVIYNAGTLSITGGYAAGLARGGRGGVASNGGAGRSGQTGNTTQPGGRGGDGGRGGVGADGARGAGGVIYSTSGTITLNNLLIDGLVTGGFGGNGGSGGEGGNGGGGGDGFTPTGNGNGGRGVDGASGGIPADGGNGGKGGDAIGGLIALERGSLTVTRSTLLPRYGYITVEGGAGAAGGAGGNFGNGGYGGAGGGATLTGYGAQSGGSGGNGVAGQDGGDAGHAGAGGSAKGGALSLASGTATLLDCTIGGNSNFEMQVRGGAGGDNGSSAGGVPGMGGFGGSGASSAAYYEAPNTGPAIRGGNGGNGAASGKAGAGGNGGKGGDALGGAIFSDGLLRLERSTISYSKVEAGAGGAGSIAGYGQTGGSGGYGAGCGGGAFNNEIPYGTGGDGGKGSDAASYGNGGDGGKTAGGAVYATTASIFNSTFAFNTVTGANAANAPAYIAPWGDPGAGGGGGNGDGNGTDGSTGATAPAVTNGTLGMGRGGALYFPSGTATLMNNTIVNNSASAFDLPETGGGGIANDGATVDVTNTIVTGNQSFGAPDVRGSFGGEGFNLLGDTFGSTGFGAGNNDLIGVDPQLGPLQDNGGPTKTMVAAFNSPVMDRGYTFNLPVTDQRGFGRIVGGTADIGATEDQTPRLRDHVLYVDGTPEDDVIVAQFIPTNVTKIEVLRNGVSIAEAFATDVVRIVIDGHEGNDDISIDASLPQAVTFIGNTGNDTLVGGTQNDSLLGGPGYDLLAGRDGDDTLWGAENEDVLLGDAGVDRLHGGDGQDILVGGDGADGVKSSVNGKTVYTPYLNGDAGEDIVIAGRTDYDDITVAEHRTNWNAFRLVWSVTGLPYATRQGLLQRYSSGRLSGETVHDDDELDVMDGGTGLDWYIGQATVKTGIVTDKVMVKEKVGKVTEEIYDLPPPGIFPANVVKFDPASGDLTITGTKASETFRLSYDAGTGAIFVTDKRGYTSAGNGTFPTLTNTKKIIINLGAGNDILELDLGRGQFIGSGGMIPIKIDGGAHTDRVVLLGSDGPDKFDAGSNGINLDGLGSVDVTLSGIDGLEIQGMGADDQLSASGSAVAGAALTFPVTLNGGTGSDSLYGGAGNDVLTGGGGDNFVQGGGGFDTLVEIADGVSTVDATVDVNTVYGMHGLNGTRFSEVEAISLTGDDQDNTLNAISATLPVTLLGLGGNDKLYGSPQADKLDGGAGNDTIAPGNGKDTLAGGLGTDTLEEVVLENATLTKSTLRLTTTANKLIEQDTLSGLEQAKLTGIDTPNVINASGFTLGPVTLIGGNGEDKLTGGTKNDRLEGGGDDDTLTGGAGNDDLYGNGGQDRLFGNDGNDGLYGGAGLDTLTGGAKQDRFLYQNGDVVLDFNSAFDAKLTFAFGDRNWTEAEIMAADVGLAWLHHTTNNTRLLKLRLSINGNNVLTFFRYNNLPGADAGAVTLADNDGQGTIRVANGTFSTASLSAASVLIHEIGHNWEDENPKWQEFKDLSGWQDYALNLSAPAGFTRAIDLDGVPQPYIYLSSARFSTFDGYGKTNPYEDFASCFASYYEEQVPRLQWYNKWLFIDAFLKSVTTK